MKYHLTATPLQLRKNVQLDKPFILMHHGDRTEWNTGDKGFKDF